ncbi:choice-of-anchor tandem repeat GloVer-containing protein [Cyanobium sp. ULC082]
MPFGEREDGEPAHHEPELQGLRLEAPAVGEGTGDELDLDSCAPPPWLRRRSGAHGGRGGWNSGIDAIFRGIKRTFNMKISSLCVQYIRKGGTERDCDALYSLTPRLLSLHRTLRHFICPGAASLVLLSTTLPAVAAPAITQAAPFTAADGARPQGSLTAGAGGLFYGTTTQGGPSNRGSVFTFNSNTNQISASAFFTLADGTIPLGSLTAGAGGLFYGTTEQGGPSNSGSVFTFNSLTNQISASAFFTGVNGSLPRGSLTAGAGGLFYGTTAGGGSANLGSVFTFDSNTNQISTAASFTVVANGVFPQGSLTAGANGLFYGTTPQGGSSGFGSVFTFNSITNQISTAASFTGANGANPKGSLTAGANGLFYGTTETGSGLAGAGSVFTFDSLTNQISAAAFFTAADGANPQGNLTAGDGGLFYGTNVNGGSSGNGTVFTFNSINNQISSPVSLTGTTGAFPFGSLTAGASGLFYGTAQRGGSGNLNRGTVFTFDSGQSVPGVPGPLPILGAGIAFGASRKLRKRIKLAKT